MKKELIKCRAVGCENLIEIGRMICDKCRKKAVAEIKQVKAQNKECEHKNIKSEVVTRFTYIRYCGDCGILLGI